jgi:hypothetical protein
MSIFPYISTAFTTFKLYKSCFGTSKQIIINNKLVKYHSYLCTDKEFFNQLQLSHKQYVPNYNDKIYEFYRGPCTYSDLDCSGDEYTIDRHIIRFFKPTPQIDFYISRFINTPVRNPLIFSAFLASILFIFKFVY